MSYNTYSYQSTMTNAVRVYDEKLKKAGVIQSTYYYDPVTYYQRIYGSWPCRNFDRIIVRFDGEGSDTIYQGRGCEILTLESTLAGSAYSKLVLWYRFEQSTGVLIGDWIDNVHCRNKPDGDTASINNSGAPIGTRFLTYNGTSQYAIGGVTNMPNNSMSIACWIKTTSANSTIFSFGGGLSNNLERAVKLSSGKIQLFEKNGGSETSLLSSSTVNDGNWQHIVCTIAGISSTWKIYVNKVDVSASSVNGPGNSNLAIVHTLIAISWVNGTVSNYYGGSIDDLRIYNDVLTQSQINELCDMRTPFSGVQTSAYSDLIAWYRCEETSGTTLSDNKGSHDMTLHNSTYYTHVLNASVDQGSNSIEFSRSSTAKAYDSTTLSYGLAKLDTLGSINVDQFSVSCWIRMTQTSYHATIWQFGSPSNYREIFIRLVYIVDGGGYWSVLQRYKETSNSTNYNDGVESSSGAVNYHNNVWHNVVLTKSGNTTSDTLKLYINGSLIASTNQTNSGGKDFSGKIDHLAYGAGWHNNKWNWWSKDIQTDDYRIYNRALTVSEIAELYATK